MFSGTAAVAPLKARKTIDGYPSRRICRHLEHDGSGDEADDLATTQVKPEFARYLPAYSRRTSGISWIRKA